MAIRSETSDNVVMTTPEQPKTISTKSVERLVDRTVAELTKSYNDAEKLWEQYQKGTASAGTIVGLLQGSVTNALMELRSFSSVYLGKEIKDERIKTA